MDLLFAHDGGDPFLEPKDKLTGDRAADEAEQVEVHEPDLAKLGENANNLPDQRWAIVVPEGEAGERLASMVKPLIDKRSDDQKTPALILDVPPGMDDRQASEWKRDVYPTKYADELARPLYLCILGDIDQVSLATQQQLAIDGLPGRIACTDDAGYEAYVSKVLAWEDSPSQHVQPRSMFYTVHDGTAATRSGYGKLIKPCFDVCRDDWQNDRTRFPAHAVDNVGYEEPDPQEFLDFAAEQHPTVMFSMSHGMGPPRGRDWSPAEARERQGAMHFGREGALLPSDVASGKFLPGGFWLYFACFGAGTPSESAYRHWMEMLQKNGMKDIGPVQTVLDGLSSTGGFTSGIARSALGNPDGPLAVMGHVDLAWSYSYDEIQVKDDAVSNTNRSDNFRDILAQVVRGNRVGMTYLEIQRFLSNVSKGLNVQYDHRQKVSGGTDASSLEQLALGNLWMFHQDLSGYVLLGDPAVKLPLGEARSSGFFIPGMTRPSAEVRGEQSTDVDPERLKKAEKVILQVANEDITFKEARRLLDVSSSDTAREWEELYREAGRKALAEAMSRHVPEDDDD